MSKIIVLTPVKNEDWILLQFLTVTSLFADCIIIADQGSTDSSRSICSKFPKVKLIDNTSVEFSEPIRQKLLIEAARNLFPNEDRVLFSLDADEIISADSLNAAGWELILSSPKGTVFKFEKPTIFFDTPKTIRYPDGWPLAYKDDGAEHNARLIHSTRIPTPEYAEQILIRDIKFLHFCFVRKNIQFSKNRFYCAIENVNRIRSLRLRQTLYNKYTHADYANEGVLESTQKIWFDAFDKQGVNLKNFHEPEFYWMDFEVLKMFNQYGSARFYNDCIWHFNWEACRLEAIARNIEGVPATTIKTPSKFRILFLDIVFRFLNRITLLKRKFSSQ